MQDEILITMLKQCRDQFVYYRDQHIEKTTSTSLLKAVTNQQMIEKIDCALKEYNQSSERSQSR